MTSPIDINATIIRHLERLEEDALVNLANGKKLCAPDKGGLLIAHPKVLMDVANSFQNHFAWPLYATTGLLEQPTYLAFGIVWKLVPSFKIEGLIIQTWS